MECVWLDYNMRSVKGELHTYSDCNNIRFTVTCSFLLLDVMLCQSTQTVLINKFTNDQTSFCGDRGEDEMIAWYILVLVTVVKSRGSGSFFLDGCSYQK